jgi:hypothetical protein
VTANGAFIGGGADYADLMQVSGTSSDYEPGDVLVLPEQGEGLELSHTPYSRLVIGVYSTNPAFLGDANGIQLEESDQALTSTSIPVALVGIVPVKVSAENGAIKPGDLLVTSTTLGYAMKASPVVIEGFEIFPQGTILGKAMAHHDNGLGIIDVLVNLK